MLVRDELETERLRLRRWCRDDLDTLTRWHQDADLMRHMGQLSFSRAETEVALARYERHWAKHGFGSWAAEERAGGALVGRVGLAYHRDWPHDPEVGWLIDTPWQGQGLATEAGAALLEYGFGELGFERIVSICTAENTASRRVMAKLGLEPWRHVVDSRFGLELIVHARER